MDKTIKIAFNLRKCKKHLCACVTQISEKLNTGEKIDDEVEKRYKKCFQDDWEDHQRKLEQGDCVKILFKS
jgi:hypothetical protein